MGIELHKEDLLSVVVSTSKLDPSFAHRLLHFTQGLLILALFIQFKFVCMDAALPEMTPSKVLTLAKCMPFTSQKDDDLFKLAKQLQFCKEVSRGTYGISWCNINYTCACRTPVDCIMGRITTG